IDSPVGGLDGGIGNNFSDQTFAQVNAGNLIPVNAPAGSLTAYRMQTGPATGNSGYLVDGATAYWQQSDTYNNLRNNLSRMDPVWDLYLAQAQSVYGIPGTYADAYHLAQNDGAAASAPDFRSDRSRIV